MVSSHCPREINRSWERQWMFPSWRREPVWTAPNNKCWMASELVSREQSTEQKCLPRACVTVLWSIFMYAVELELV